MKVILRPLFIGIIAFLLTAMLIITPNAEAYEFDDSTDITPDHFEYIPKELFDNSNEIFQNDIDNINIFLILQMILSRVFDNTIFFAPQISISITTIIISSICCHLRNNKYNIYVNFLSLLSTILLIIPNSIKLLSFVKLAINNTQDILSAIIPCTFSVHMLTGSSFSATASTSTIMTLLTLFEQTTSRIFPVLVTITFSLFIAEKLHPPLGALGLTKSLKKNLASFLIFAVSFLLAIIALNGSLAASKDSLTLRGIKFATANIIPIIGSSVSEATKLLIAGTSKLKNTLGLLSAYAILSGTLPTLVTLILHKLSLRFLGLCSSLLSSPSLASVYDGVADITDMFTAILTAVTVLSFFTLFLFTNSIFL